MSYTRCPYCHRRFFTSEGEVQVTARQQEILRAIADLMQANQGRPVTTTAIATRVNWSVRTVRYELSHLEHMGEIRRNQYQAGWLLPERAVMMVA